MDSLKPDSSTAAEDLLCEFGQYSHEASQAFCWATGYPLHDPAKTDAWNFSRHGWKHVSARDLNANAKDVLEPRGKPLIRQAYFCLPSSEDLELLVKRANEGDPKAVVRLWYICRHREKLRGQILKGSEFWLTDDGMKKLVVEVPDPVKLGTEYIQAILKNPGKESNDKRRHLKDLTSQSSIFGTYSQNEGSQVPDDWADITFIRAMAFSLVKQVRYARRFLKNAGLSPREVETTSLKSLEIGSGLAKFVKSVGFKRGGKTPPDHQRANQITASLLSLHPSHVKKIYDQTKHRP
ncbi:MAG TPA: hypothetical protein VOA88_05040 [Candidatus Dormibacteraeota bacterium]|nr:hypothetical protein [Candidatus Dormibacteraeota bacterium]